MTSNFDARKLSQPEATKEMDSLQRDRFELLSAYVDGEVTASERARVQELLATDVDMQRLHARLLKLRQGLQKLPVPSAEATPQETAQQVFSRLDRRRTRRTVFWGGAAIAAMVVSAFSGMIPGTRSLVQQIADLPNLEQAPEPPLMISLNQPVIDIPKAPVASPENSVEPPALRYDSNKNNLN
ncbi:MAG TPA: zf-HC2 domain-containing protein [Chroococcales cyanobacterium]|jgi:anti-sigma-K factor RskA